MLVPEYKFALALLTNSDEGRKALGDVQRWVLKEHFGVTETDPEPIESTEDDLHPFVGRYVRPALELELGLLSGHLVGQAVHKQGFPDKDAPPPPAPPPMSFARCEPDRLLITSGPYRNICADVLRKPDGSVGWLRVSGRLQRRVE